MVVNFEKEIEIKFKIDDNIASKLKTLKLEPYEEIDEYFFTKENVGKNIFLRFRKKKGKIFLELKVITLGEKESKDVYEADEIETEITKEQYENIKKMFNVIFPVKIQVRKIRSKGELNDCELYYDKVDGLGDYLEIEGPKNNIMEICKKFNIDIEKNRDKEEGYAKMTLKRMGLI